MEEMCGLCVRGAGVGAWGLIWMVLAWWVEGLSGCVVQLWGVEVRAGIKEVDFNLWYKKDDTESSRAQSSAAQPRKW